VTLEVLLLERNWVVTKVMWGTVEDGGGDLVLVLLLLRDVHAGYWLFLVLLLLQGTIWDCLSAGCVLLKKRQDSLDE